MSGFPLKISAYLRPILVEQDDRFVIPSDEGVSIEATNFSEIAQGNPNIVYDYSETGFLGAGYMRVDEVQNGASETWPSISFPVQFDAVGKYKLFARVRSSSLAFDYRWIINDEDSEPQTAVVSAVDSWEWIETDLVVPTTSKFTLRFEVRTENVWINCFHITTTSVPGTVEFQPIYITVHAKMYELGDDGLPSSELPVYDAKTTLEELTIDDWYNFNMTPLLGQEEQSDETRYTFVLFTTGNGNQNYITWDYSNAEIDPYVSQCSLRYDLDSNTWIEDCEKRYALRAYTFRDSLDASACSLVTPASAIATNTVEVFDDPDTSPTFFNTRIVDLTSSTNKVELKLPDRIVSLLVDQSGSMTWNDSSGLRYELSRRMISRVDSTYPGDVKWNIFSFEGTPIRVNFFAVVENDSIDTNDTSAVANSFFSDQESGYAGVRIVRKTGSYPDNAIDGDIVTEGFFDRAYDDNLVEDEDYYYKAFTFDTNGTFSNGVELLAVPRERTIPHGVGQFTANILRGSGVKIDEFVVGAWHLGEGTGSTAYDFTTSQIHLSYTLDSDPIWLNSNDVPNGNSGVRLNGSDMGFQGADTNAHCNQNEVTIMGWMYPFQQTGYEVLICRENSSSTDFCLGRFDDTLFFTTDYATLIYGGTNFTWNEWNHVAVVFNKNTSNVKFYLNGILTSSQTYGGTWNDIQGSIGLGNPIRTAASPFFGKITEFTVHKTARSSSYIAEAATQPGSPQEKVLDNGDRIVVLNFSVPEDFDFVGGKVRVVEKEAAGDVVYSYTGNLDADGKPERINEGFGLPPYHENDGTAIYNETASAGAFSITLNNNFVHDRVYHYKIFSQNTIGNYSNWADSPVLSITIPKFDTIDDQDRAIGDPSPSLPQITTPTVQVGNRKNYISWTYLSTDSRVKQVRVYYSAKAYPIFGKADDVSDGDLVFSGNTDQLSFVHRNIDNDAVAYYAIVTMDKYGYRSEPYYFQAIPRADADEIGIPLLEVKKFHYEVVSEEALSIGWEQPIRFQKNIEGWFDDRVAIFAQITDEFGSPIADDSRITFTAKASTSSAQNAENVFGETIDRTSFSPRPEDTFILSSTPMGNGVIKGLVRMTTDFNVISAINDLDLSIKVAFSIPDRENAGKNVFEFSSLPISIKMKNPFKVELVNQSGDHIKHLCKQEVPLEDAEFIASGGQTFDPNLEQDFDGTFIRRSRPFVARMKVLYRDQPIRIGGKIFVAVYEASDPACDNPGVENGKFIPAFYDQQSRSVRPTSTTFDLKVGNETNSDGITEDFSYADIPLSPPKTPQGAMLFAQASYNGYVARKKMYLAFENILRVELTVNEPESNCIDQAEQFASVYVIDPDSPDPSRPDKVRVSDNEICKWTLRKGITGRDRPFFSLDTIPNGPGVFSYIRGGTARQVFFGPACGVTWTLVDLGPERGGPALLPEMYAMKAAVVHDGLTAFEERPLVLYPPGNPNSFGSRFLMQFSRMLNEIYADGYDYELMTIHRDPNSAGGSFGSSFRACSEELGGTLFIMNYGQPVELESGDEFEILYGDEIEISLDPYIDEFVFEQYTKETSFATVPLNVSSDVTQVYFRINKFIGPLPKASSDDSDKKAIQNRCSSIEVPQGTQDSPNDRVVSGRTSIVFNGETRFLNGGGNLQNGLPPTVLRMKEPLKVRIVDVRRSGLSVDSIIVDGHAEHTFLVEVSFSEKTVPNGTPVFLQIGGTNPSKITLYETIVYTSQYEDEILLEGVKSYAQFTIFPLNPVESFSAQVQAECRYDKRGDVSRSMTACVTITYDSSVVQNQSNNNDGGQIDNVFSAALVAYNTVSDSWTDLSSMKHSRGGLTLTWAYDTYGTQLYAIGGINGRSVTAYCERYEIGSDTWSDAALMPTPRFGHSAIEDSGMIYVFGGITVEDGNLVVTDVVERYDPLINEWTQMASMPTINNSTYGVAMGSSVKIGNLVYITCGVTAIENKGGISALNDRVLVYDLDSNEWTYSDAFTDADLDMYARIAPFAFVDTDDNSIQVSGGAIIVGTGKDQVLEFVTDALSVDTSTLLITRNDAAYQNIPRPRYKGNVTSIDNSHYFMGGSNKKSLISRTFEKIDASASPFGFSEPTQPDVAKQSFGMTNDGDRYIYVGGGVTSGRPPGFLQINASAMPDRIRLDGKQSAGIDIELLDDSGEHPSTDVRVLVRGYLVFPNSAATQAGGGSDQGQQGADDKVDRQALVYPVVFSSNDFVISNGFGTTTLLPRSDDILRKIDEIKKKLGIQDPVLGEGSQSDSLIIQEGQIREPYQIRIQITVLDDFFYGQTVVDIQDNEDPDNNSSQSGGNNNSGGSDNSGGDTGASSSGTDFQDCIGFDATRDLTTNSDGSNNTDAGGDAIVNGLDENSVVFQLNPSQSPQLTSPSVSYYCDISWLPQVVSHLYTNDGTADDALQVINRLRNSVSFGGSPFYDGMQKIASSLLGEDLNVFPKTIYAHTDNEENLSLLGLQETIDEIQSVDGFGKTPVVLNNFSVVFPTTLSALVARTDTNSLEQMARDTGGQSQTILDAAFIDDVLNNTLGRVAGSIGWGTYEVVVDLGVEAVVHNIFLDFELFDNTDGNWKVASSNDGFNFEDDSDQYSADNEVEFFRLSGRYFRFRVTLLSGLSASILEAYESQATPGSPSLLSINVNYSVPKESFIFVNAESPDHSAQQIAVSVRANRPTQSIIDIGAATSDSYNWADYQNGLQPAADQYGKIYIPIRTQQTDASLNEPLTSIDGIAWQAKYGSWNPKSGVIVKNADDEVVDSSTYKTYPRNGLIVFNTKVSGPLIIDVENAAKTRLGIRVVNKFAEETVAIEGFGFFYNTNVFLPSPLSEKTPVASNLLMLPDDPNIYSKVSGTYDFSDLNRDQEDKEKTEIRWFINGIEREYLRGLLEWNDLSNADDPVWVYAFSFKPGDVPQGTSVEEYARTKGESLLKINDLVYFTVKPNDGKLFGTVARSPSVKVVTAPPFVTSLEIRGRTSTGETQSAVTTNTTAYADYNFFDDGGENASTIIWYVNGEEFKRGALGGTTGGFLNNELVPGELRATSGVVGLVIGNDLEIEIRPATGQTLGNPVRSNTKTVENALPEVSNVVVSPAQPTSSSNLQVEYSFNDVDVRAGSTLQSNQSSIRWYRKRGNSDFEEVTSALNKEVVLNVLTAVGDQWYANVIPFDGVSVGITVKSNIVTIG